MKRIYSTAATVYVDLGDTAGFVGSVGEFTARIGDSGGMGMPDASLRGDTSQEHPFDYMTVFQALKQPWFTRTWII